MEYAADDVAFIKRRLEEIAREEAILSDPDINTASEHDLELIARGHGFYRDSGETDFDLRTRVKAGISTA